MCYVCQPRVMKLIPVLSCQITGMKQVKSTVQQEAWFWHNSFPGSQKAVGSLYA